MLGVREIVDDVVPAKLPKILAVEVEASAAGVGGQPIVTELIESVDPIDSPHPPTEAS
jgi:hypothetical protein